MLPRAGIDTYLRHLKFGIVRIAVQGTGEEVQALRMSYSEHRHKHGVDCTAMTSISVFPSKHVPAKKQS
jgi:hypothetical protein